MRKQKKENTGLKTILVIEDELPLREAISIKLAKEGFLCLLAETAEAGLKILEQEKPDLIWLDLLMPGMGGFAFLEKIRQQPKLRDLPVVIVSVSASPEKIRLAFGLNVVDYLVKSQFRLADIVGRIGGYIKK
ncbi:MAG: response regulator [Patescibacteria group bacterium]|nr:response regulator [Patescibacteria group bacterium]